MTATYDRQEGETNKAYAAFCIYRDLGVDRTLEKAAKNFYPSDPRQIGARNRSQLSVWSRHNNWVKRCQD